MGEMDSSMSVDEDLGGTGIAPPLISAPAVGDAKMGGGRGSTIDTDLLEIPVEEFGEKVKIGRGSFGEVFRCQVRTPCRSLKYSGNLVKVAGAAPPLHVFMRTGPCGSSWHF